jgi:hypothetical protein
VDAYTARVKELKARLHIELKAFSNNPSAGNYRNLESTMLEFQNLVKNTSPAEYIILISQDDPTSTLESA